MTRDDLAPLGESESFPCPSCGGGGLDPEAGTATLVRCRSCGGSGYGPPPPSLDREVSHCLQRLAAWAHRDIPKEEN
jgi:hypothetical protein